MSSSVFYKFKSQKDPSRVEFDGTGISVFELKRDIIIKSGLGDGTDFDFSIFNEDGKEEYDDDTAIIPRSTTVIARRLPAIKKGAGRAQRYMTGKMPVNMKNSGRKEQASKAKTTTNAITKMNEAMTEEEKMAAMFSATEENWAGQLDEMGKQTKIQFQHKKTSEGEPPLGYVCYRCGEKGHWIKECPTNNDPNYENKPRIKRTTGIPRSFLKTVEKPTSDGSDDSKAPSGVMVNAEGQFVVAEPDKKSWEQFQAKTKSSAAAQKAAALGDKELQDRGLECSIDKRIFRDPMKTPCCEKTYCNECITNALIESDFTCPGCQTDGVLIDDLKLDDGTSAKINAYLAEKTAAAKKERSQSPSVKSEPVENEKAKSKSPAPQSPNNKAPSKPKSPTPAPSSTIAIKKETTPVKENSKKRSADELLENPKIPKGPKAMQQQEAQKKLLQQQQQQQQMMTGMNSFPNMPFLGGQGFQNFNSGFNGMPNMMNFPMGMSNPMMGMNPMMNMGMMNGMMPGMFNGMGNMGGMMSGSMGNGINGGMNGGGIVNANGIPTGPSAGANGGGSGFQNQQRTVFADPLLNEEDNAYFRKPVNPHRHQGQRRRARPSDYREL